MSTIAPFSTSATIPSAASTAALRLPGRWRRRLMLALLALIAIWSSMAIAFGYEPLIARAPLVSALLGLTLVAIVARRQRSWAVPLVLVGCGATILWYRSREPSGKMEWAVTQSRMPSTEFSGDLVTITNVRNFNWLSATDYEPAWETRTYDLDKLISLDVVVTFWGPVARIGHTCLSFGFSDGQYVHISVESRRAAGEGFNPIAGQFKRYELIYVVADERDALGSRALHFGERVHVYPTRSKPERIRLLFVGMLTWADYLREHPAYYSTLFRNCTITILEHVNRIQPSVVPWDRRIWLNGRFDEMCYELGWLQSGLPFEETNAATRINEFVKENGLTPDFSVRLRERLHAALKLNG